MPEVVAVDGGHAQPPEHFTLAVPGGGGGGGPALLSRTRNRYEFATKRVMLRLNSSTPAYFVFSSKL